MKTIYEVPLTIYPPNQPRAYQTSSSNHGHVLRSRKARKLPARKRPRPGLALIFITSPARWRRAWLGQLAKRWKWLLSDAQRTWWETQAPDTPFHNENFIKAARTGFELYMWYQFRHLTRRMDRYIPFPFHATDFQFQFTPPWDPPVLEGPTIISATAPGTVVVRCLNQTPAALTLAPCAWWKIDPPVKGSWTRGFYPWYWFNSVLDGAHTKYSYYLADRFPSIKPGTRAQLVHCLINTAGGDSIYTDPVPPTYAVDAGGSDAPWTDPDNVCTYDASEAVSIIKYELGKTKTNLLLASGFIFDPPIPPTATIQYIIIEIMAQCDSYYHRILDDTIRLTKAGTMVGDNLASVSWTFGQTFPWGYNTYSFYNPPAAPIWTPDDINNLSLGLAIRGKTNQTYGWAYARIPYVRAYVIYVLTPAWITSPSMTPFVFT
jgi:hypothetical protein